MSIVRVVGGALCLDGKWLAAQRSATMSEPLAWEFPGGKVKAAESDEAALERELTEELGIEVRVGSLVGSAKIRRDGRIIELVVYEVELTRGFPVVIEHAALGWFTPESLAALNSAEADLPIAHELLARIALSP